MDQPCCVYEMTTCAFFGVRLVLKTHEVELPSELTVQYSALTGEDQRNIANKINVQRVFI